MEPKKFKKRLRWAYECGRLKRAIVKSTPFLLVASLVILSTTEAQTPLLLTVLMIYIALVFSEWRGPA